MLKIIVSGEELFDESIEEFIPTIDDVVLELEHSLVSLSKWETKFCKPFLGIDEKTREETLGYIEAMIINDDYPSDVFDRMDSANLDLINEYIGSTQSATTFSESPQQKSRARSEIVTSELIYFWMVSYNIPFECETWHLNRLFALLRICNIKNSDPKKMSRNEIAQRTRDLNAQRKAELGTTG